MKKTIPFLIVGILVLSGLGATAISNDNETRINDVVFLSKPVVNEEEEYITLTLTEATNNLMRTDMPIIPILTKIYILPFGTHIDEVTVTYSPEKEIKISKPIKPAPEPQIIGSIRTLERLASEQIKSLYQNIIYYPEERSSYETGAGLKNEEHVIYLTVHLNPIRYDVTNDMVLYSDSASIEIEYTEPKVPIIFLDEYDLLIISPSQFADEFTTPKGDVDMSFIDYKNSHGTLTKLVTLEDIYGDVYFSVSGDDEQEEIKYFIKEAIENWGITYLLIVGGGLEGSETFPVRYVYIPSGSYEPYFPSDLYYADIYDGESGFSNWDADGNGKYVSSRTDRTTMDVYPDVYMGKLPCVNIKDLSTAIEKILWFEEHNKVLNKILQMGGDTFPGDRDDVDEGQYANEVVMTKLPGYSTTQLWVNPPPITLTVSNIASGFNGNIDFADFSGHGNYAGWSTHPHGDEEGRLPTNFPYDGFSYVDTYARLTNANKYPVVVLNACSNNKFTDHEECFGWSLIKHANGGGIASYGATGIGYGSHGYGEVERLFGWMEVNLFDGLYQNKIIGEVWGNAITGYKNSFPGSDSGDYKTMLEMALFGDPTLKIEDGPDPKVKDVKIPIINTLIERLIDTYPIIERVLRLLKIA